MLEQLFNPLEVPVPGGVVDRLPVEDAAFLLPLLFVMVVLLLVGGVDTSLMEGRKEMFYLTMHSTHFIYGYMASDIWLRIILIVRKETRCRHIVCSFRLAARVLLYAPSHRQDNTYHGLCYTSRGALAGTRNSSMGPPWRIDPKTHRTMSEHSYQRVTSRSLQPDGNAEKFTQTVISS